MDLRADFDAAEARREDEDEEEDEEEGEEEEAAEEGEEEEAAEEGEDEGEDEAALDEDEEEAPKPKKKPKKPAKKKPEKEPKKRTRAAKIVRMRVVWGVFNNSNQRVATYEYTQRKEAEEHAARLAASKNPPQTFFVQPVREPIEEKKE
jgi:hypothetical protein